MGVGGGVCVTNGVKSSHHDPWDVDRVRIVVYSFTENMYIFIRNFDNSDYEAVVSFLCLRPFFRC